MFNIIIVSIIFGSIVALAALICGTVLLIIKTRSRATTGGANSEEAKTIQEIYRGLDKLESRIEALETILEDNTKREKSDE